MVQVSIMGSRAVELLRNPNMIIYWLNISILSCVYVLRSHACQKDHFPVSMLSAYEQSLHSSVLRRDRKTCNISLFKQNYKLYTVSTCLYFSVFMTCSLGKKKGHLQWIYWKTVRLQYGIWTVCTLHTNKHLFIFQCLYDLLMNFLEERGISNEFVEKLSDFSTAYEHSLYIALLENTKKFVSGQ